MKPTRDDILKSLQEEGVRPMKVREMAGHLRVPAQHYRAFRRIIKELELEGQLVRLRNGRFTAQNHNLSLGRLSVTSSGFGFLSSDGGGPDVFIRASSIGRALSGDRVLVRVTRRGGTRAQPEGEVVRVVERARLTIAGVLSRRGSHFTVAPDNPRFPPAVRIDPGSAGDAGDGDAVAVEFEDWEPGSPVPVGRVVAVLGRADDPTVDILAIIHARHLPLQFPPHVVEASRRAADDHLTQDVSGRVDLRGHTVFTIDPDDARDHDDALSLERRPDGIRVVGIHIADVSAYVEEGTPLDHEAALRGTSVYLTGRTIPMLPEALSAGTCSLVPGEDRLAISVFVSFNAEHAQAKSWIERTIVRSRARLTYSQAQSALTDEPASEATPFVNDLRGLHEIAKQLNERCAAAGAIDLDLPEPEIELDEQGHPTGIRPRERLDSHRLIEAFMLLANHVVAERLTERGVPFLNRVHDPPDAEKLEAFTDVAAEFGHPLPRGPKGPRELQSYLASIAGKPGAQILNERLLRSMKKAIYTPENRGHFGIGSRCYTHFTSPIRRYPDLLTQRILKEVTWGELGKDRTDQLNERLPGIGDLATEREIVAQKAEWESIKVKQVHYYEDRIGDVGTGTITGVGPLGIFVRLDTTLAEGLVHVQSLSDDYYECDDHRSALVGRRRGRVFRIGDRADVAVVRADRKQRQLDFELVEPRPSKRRRGRRPRPNPFRSP